MKILKKKDECLLSSEVYCIVVKDFLRNTAKETQVEADEIRCRYSYLNVLHYLETTHTLFTEDISFLGKEDLNILTQYGLKVACCKTISRSAVTHLLDALYANYELNQMELLQIANFLPTELVDLFVLMENSAYRFDEKTLNSMLDLCRHAMSLIS
jgi:DNA-directed RNA polymerase subunit F